MNKIYLLDVTLRDGGYKTNFHFQSELISQILINLDKSGIDYIEVGYRNGSFKPIPDIGPTGICSSGYLTFCKKYINLAKLTVICHPQNITEDDLKEMQDCGVEAVRICFPVNNPILGYKLIEKTKKLGFNFFINLTRISQYEQEQIYKLVKDFSIFDPDAVYLADSNGSLTPEKVASLFTYIQNRIETPLGIHAHDNLFLAQANTISAINHGAKFVDASLMGLGKGAGNLRTEGIVSFLLSQGIEQFDICHLLDAAKCIKLKINNADNNLEMKDIIMGIFDLSQDDAAMLGAFSSSNEYYNRAVEYYRNIKLCKDKNFAI